MTGIFLQLTQHFPKRNFWQFYKTRNVSVLLQKLALYKLTLSLLNLLVHQEYLALKLHTMILDCANKSFNAISHLLICMRQLRIIEYVQRQQTAKTSNMESFATIVKSNGFIEKYPTTPVGRFKRCWGQKIAPVLILMTLWKKSLVQSFVVLWSVLMKLWSYKVLNPA